MSMRKLLITGASGFVGKEILKKVINLYEINAVVRNPDKLKDFSNKIKIWDSKIHDINFFSDIIKKINPDYVINLVGILKETKTQTYQNTNYLYSKNLYESLKNSNVKKIIHMSALGTSKNSLSKYHKTKYLAEEELKKLNIDYIIFRPSFISGKNQLIFRKLNFFSRFFPFFIFPDIEYYFQPVDIDDVVECFIKAIETEHTGTFNLCGMEKVSFKELIKKYLELINRKVLFFPFKKDLLKYIKKDFYFMMHKNNTCDENENYPNGVLELLKRNPLSYSKSLEKIRSKL